MDEHWQEIERIYHAAREVDKGARAEFLAKACGGDVDLRREVESLLVQADQHESFMQSPAIEVAGEALAKKKQLSDTANPDLELGAMIAHYRLTGRLGEGGMGEVYRARDTKLQRDVAVKILPQAMAQDAQRMARFEREAQVLASLNHPNIAAIYGLEESNGIHALVMELVKGKTLGERLRRTQPLTRPASRDTLSPQAGRGEKFNDLAPSPSGKGWPAGPGEGSPLTIEDALPIAKQIGEALEYAHERGVIHRDLKPANVKITPEGMVKVLDFGLAKAVAPGLSPARSDADLKVGAPDSPSPTTITTQPGLILGTAAYMSPEQAKGQGVDRRCDIWAFGCVVYEMLSGRKAFEGETISDVLVAVLTKEPDWNSLPEATPPTVLKLIHRCLVKDAKQRLQAIGEARIAIEETLSSHAGAPYELPLQSGDQQASSHSRLMAPLPNLQKKAFFAGLAAGVLIALIVAYCQMPPLPAPRVSGYVQLTHDGVPKELAGTDGSRLYMAEVAPGSVSAISQVSVAGGEVAQIRAPSPALHVLNVSPDGSDLLLVDLPGQSTEGPLWAVPILGGSPRRLAETIGYHGAWSADKKKLEFTWNNGLYVANGDGTEARRIASLPGALSRGAQTGIPFLSSAWSPDGHQIRFTIFNSRTQVESIWQVSADGSSVRQLLPGWHTGASTCCGKWTPDGKYFVFQSGGQIWARREAGSFIGKSGHEPVQLTSGAIEYSSPLPSKDGRKLFAIAGLPRGELQRYDTKSGQFLPFLSGVSASCVSFAPDNQRVAYVTYPEGSLWLSKADGSQRLQLTFPPMTVAFPRWSPDAKRIAFMGQLPNRPWQIYDVSAAGGSPSQVTRDGRNYADQTWSPDGTSLVLSIAPWASEPGVSGVYELNLKTRKERKLPGSDGLFSPRLSPDGRYVAALTLDDKKMMLFDYTVQKWTELTALAQQGWQEWSDDGQYVTFWGTSNQGEPGIYRARVINRKVEMVVSLKDFHQAPGLLGGWLGIAPDNSPLLVKDTGTQDVVSMDWIAP